VASRPSMAGAAALVALVDYVDIAKDKSLRFR
jgi:hypothetical protein